MVLEGCEKIGFMTSEFLSIYIYLFTPKQKKSPNEIRDFKNINDEKNIFSLQIYID